MFITCVITTTVRSKNSGFHSLAVTSYLNSVPCMYQVLCSLLLLVVDLFKGKRTVDLDGVSETARYALALTMALAFRQTYGGQHCYCNTNFIQVYSLREAYYSTLHQFIKATQGKTLSNIKHFLMKVKSRTTGCVSYNVRSGKSWRHVLDETWWTGRYSHYNTALRRHQRIPWLYRTDIL